MKKRHELPNFTKINVEVDVEKILKLFNDNFENLEKTNTKRIMKSMHIQKAPIRPLSSSY